MLCVNIPTSSKYSVMSIGFMWEPSPCLLCESSVFHAGAALWYTHALSNVALTWYPLVDRWVYYTLTLWRHIQTDLLWIGLFLSVNTNPIRFVPGRKRTASELLFMTFCHVSCLWSVSFTSCLLSVPSLAYIACSFWAWFIPSALLEHSWIWPGQLPAENRWKSALSLGLFTCLTSSSWHIQLVFFSLVPL